MTTVGQLLSDAREQKKMTIQEVAEITKIRPMYVRALEEGRYSEFNSNLHAQGFLLNYAKFLGLDLGRLKALYRRERRIKDEPMRSSIFTSKDKPKITVTPAIIVFPLIAAAILGVILYFGNQYRKFAQPPFLTVEAPIDNIVTQSDILTVTGQVEVGARLTVENLEVTAIDNLGFFEINVALPIEGPNKISIVAENSIGKQSIIERTVVYEPEPERLLTLTLSLPEGEDAVEVGIGVDTEVLQPITLEAGSEYTVAAVSQIHISTANPENIVVIANNQTLVLNTVSGEDELSNTTIYYENGLVGTR